MGSNANDSYSDPSFIQERDKNEKKLLVCNTISANCKSSSNKRFQEINHAINDLNDGSKLVCQTLSGGHTNYSYKVFVDNHPEICIFAKISFEFALWNPDKSSHYDLQRTENEFEIMETMSHIVPNCVVPPLACWDLEQDGQRMKLLVTEWSHGDEQFSNQFIDGSVDPRIAPKLADTLSSLHSIKDFNPEFNVAVKSCMENFFEQMTNYVYVTSQSENPIGRTEAYLVEMGIDKTKNIAEASISNYYKRDCLIHSDSHAFNILVEAKPSITDLELFGPTGSMVLCDWEMSMAGPMGRDVGIALAFPISCNIAHALNGHVVESIRDYITSLLDCYCAKMADKGMSSNEIKALYRSIIGCCGSFQFNVFYYLKIHLCFPVQNDEDKAYVRDALGVLGLKMMRFSYDADFHPESTSLDEMKSLFDDLWQDEVAKAHAKFTENRRKSKHIMRPRRSSVFRGTSRRISDAMINFAPADNTALLSIIDDDDLV